MKSGNAESSIDVLVERIGVTAPAHSAAGRILPITKTSTATDCNQGKSVVHTKEANGIEKL